MRVLNAEVTEVGAESAEKKESTQAPSRTIWIMKTPPIPSEIRTFTAQPYLTNVYEMLPAETKLYGTETLYADWDGELLLLARDFGRRAAVQRRIDDGETEPFRHEHLNRDVNGERLDGYATNRGLWDLAGRLQCGKVYGSAMAGMLRNSGGARGKPEGEEYAYEHAARTIRFAISSMANLRGVACLGELAWKLTMEMLEAPKSCFDWRGYWERRQPLQVDGVRFFALRHTCMMKPSKQHVVADWTCMARSLDVPVDGTPTPLPPAAGWVRDVKAGGIVPPKSFDIGLWA